jgi:RNA polymerase sigma-70 factor (ECF subfamily)
MVNEPEALDNSFESLVAREIHGLYRYAYSLVGSSAEAEDLVGETIVRALERQTQFRGGDGLRSWLHRMLRNIAIDRTRHHSPEHLAEDVEVLWSDESYQVDAQALIERMEVRSELQEALFHLPVIYREVVVLHDAEGWSTPEVAALLGEKLPTIKQRLRRGRMMLVTSLAKGDARKMANKDVVLSCAQARAQVCDYIDHELPPRQAQLLEQHLAHCATCPSLYRSLVGVTEKLGNLHDPDSVIPKDIAERIRHSIRQHQPQTRSSHQD